MRICVVGGYGATIATKDHARGVRRLVVATYFGCGEGTIADMFCADDRLGKLKGMPDTTSAQRPICSPTTWAVTLLIKQPDHAWRRMSHWSRVPSAIAPNMVDQRRIISAIFDQG
jgi:hypothetical protein